MTNQTITNRPGPNCELTIRIKFNDLERFREDYHKQLRDGSYFLKTTRSKPLDTRVQLIFIISPQSPEPTEVWSWGTIDKIVTPEEAIETQTTSGIRIKLMDITKQRQTQIESLFGVDDAVKAVLQAHSKPPENETPPQKASYQVNRSARQDLIERVRDIIRLSDADYYVLLGIPKDAKNEEVRSAYRRRSKEFHPDQYFRKIPEELMQDLQRAFQKLTTAYRTLTDAKRRVSYDISINNYANPDAIREAMPHVKRQKAFNQNYKKMVEPRNERVQQLLEAVEQDLSNNNPKAAFAKLKIAAAMDPLNPVVRQKTKQVKGMLS